MRSNNLKRIFALTVACIVAMIAAWRLGLFGWGSTADRLYDAVREGERAYAKVAMVKLVAPDAQGEIERIIAGVQVDADPSITPGRVRELMTCLQEFVRLRLVTYDAKAYRNWRLAQGCTFASIAQLDRRTDLLRDYPAVFGRPAPPRPDAELLYFEHWDVMPTLFDGANELRALAADPEGWSVRVGYSGDRSDPRLKLPERSGVQVWYGPVSAAFRSWFDPPVNPADLVARHGRVLAAEVGVVSEWADGSRRPILLAFIHEPSRNRWFLWLMNENNYDTGQVKISARGY